MIDNIPQEADALRAAKEQPLGVLPQPNELPRGCIAAGDRAFFCDYVLDYLARAGISKEQVAKGGYLIKTTLDPDVQDAGEVGDRRHREPRPRRRRQRDERDQARQGLPPGAWRWPATAPTA